MVDTTSIAYDFALAGYAIPCTATGHTSLTCVLQKAAVTTLEAISTSRDTLKVQGLSSAITAG